MTCHHDLQVRCFRQSQGEKTAQGRDSPQGQPAHTHAHASPISLEKMRWFLTQCPQRHKILQVLLRASVHCCLSKFKVFSVCNCIWLWLKQSHRRKAVHIFLWACFSDLSVQRVFLGLRTWHNMTSCQVSKHGVAGDKTAASKDETDVRNGIFYVALPILDDVSSLTFRGVITPSLTMEMEHSGM